MSLPENPPAKGKYAPLYSYLMTLNADEWPASFRDVEAVLGFPLPRSARLHQPWWSNQANAGSHSHAQAWQRAGWKARNVNLVEETLLFQRVTRATPHAGTHSLVSSAVNGGNIRPEATAPEETTTRRVSGENTEAAATLFEHLVRLNQGLTNIMNEGRRVLKRIVQSYHDLSHAAECAEQILQRDLHSATAGEDKGLLRCLNTALIVSYALPFSGNRESPDVRKTLPAEYLDVLSEEQRHLHEQLIEIRNRDHAHSDPEGRSVSVGVRSIGAIPLGRDAFAPLPRESIERVAELIARLQAKLAEGQIRIQSTLKVGERF